jgi:hypothetical protein
MVGVCQMVIEKNLVTILNTPPLSNGDRMFLVIKKGGISFFWIQKHMTHSPSMATKTFCSPQKGATEIHF